MCERLRWIVEEGLKWTWPETADRLQYETTATLYEVRRGKRFPDITRLAVLGQSAAGDGRTPNLDWLLTGRGDPMTGFDTRPNHHALARELSALKPSQQKAVRAIIKQFRNS
jgi:hypothetical protein